MYNNNNNGFADSGYLSRTSTPPTPVRNSSPFQEELDNKGSYSN